MQKMSANDYPAKFDFQFPCEKSICTFYLSSYIFYLNLSKEFLKAIIIKFTTENRQLTLWRE